MPDPGKNRAPVAPALQAAARKHGRPILCGLTMSLKIARLYSFLHPNVKAALDDLDRQLGAFLSSEGTLRISRVDDSLYLNDVHIKPDFGSYHSFQSLAGILKERDIGEIAFEVGIARGEIESLLKLLNAQARSQEMPGESFLAAAARSELPHVRFSREGQLKDRTVRDIDSRLLTMGIYFRTIALFDAVLAAAQEGKNMNLLRLRHAVQDIADIACGEEPTLLSLVNVKDRGVPGSNHAVNVAILSVALGVRLGLSKKLLGDLGFSALLHDIGKARLPEALRSSSQRDAPAEDLPLLNTHVFTGARSLLHEGMAEALVKSVLVAFLHHYRYDRTGYPKLMATREQNLLTRIVSVADFYDNATTARDPARKGRDAESALRSLLDGAGTEFDPLVVKAFVNLMGLYPLGCMVRLDSGEVATVIAPPSNPRFLDRPTVRILSSGPEAAGENTVNLLDRDESGRFRRTILKLYQQEEIRLDLEEYLTVI